MTKTKEKGGKKRVNRRKRKQNVRSHHAQCKHEENQEKKKKAMKEKKKNGTKANISGKAIYKKLFVFSPFSSRKRKEETREGSYADVQRESKS